MTTIDEGISLDYVMEDISGSEEEPLEVMKKYDLGMLY